MTVPGGGAFYSRPEREMCQARMSDQCTGGRAVRIHCEVEGADISVCYNCATTWRQMAMTDSARMTGRCPRCSNWNPGTRPPEARQSLPAPLTGQIADLLNEAMHQEGMTVDVRTRVLQRLAASSPWLRQAQ